MTVIRSMEDLARAEAAAMERQRADALQARFEVRVGIASCGIAAGAGDTYDMLRALIAKENLAEVRLSQMGCNGLCALEPIVKVKELNRTPVTYGRVTPEVARRIVQWHLKKGRIVQEYVIDEILYS